MKSRLSDLTIFERHAAKKLISSRAADIEAYLHPCRKPLLPADGKACRIEHLAQWIWENGGNAPDSDQMLRMIRSFAHIQPLTYDEIWLLERTICIHALRQIIISDGIETQRALNITRCAAKLQLDQHLAGLNAAEPLLLSDPGAVYAKLTDNSQPTIRQIICSIAHKSSLSEIEIVKTASKMVIDRQIPDITQVFMTDQGLTALQHHLNIPRSRQIKLHIDPDGRWILRINIAIFAVLMIMFAFFSREWLLAALSAPLIWSISRQLFNRFAVARVPSRLLPCIKAEHISDQIRTLIVIPARISGKEELRERIDELATCSAIQTKLCTECLLLADLPDSPFRRTAEDDDIIEESYSLIRHLNDSGRRQCHVLWRDRQYNPADDCYQAHERKRGALMELCALLSGERSVFMSDGSAEHLRSTGFRYIITMDAGTLPLPGSIDQLIGMMEWPGNRYAVIQPCMRSAMKPEPSEFDRISAPDYGIPAYSGVNCDLYQNWTGRGIFGGKGIIDVASFRFALDNRLPDNAILSHDLIEGAIAHAGYAGDAIWLEYQPGTLAGKLARTERWTRGDWQLLPFLLDRSEPFDRLTRFQMADNLLHSLAAPSAMIALIAGGIAGSLFAVPAVMLDLALPLLLTPAAIDPLRLKALLTDICLLPTQAWTSASAIVRALWRTYISHSHMLDWKPSISADRSAQSNFLPNLGAAMLMLPAVRHPILLPCYTALAGLFLIAQPWSRMLMKPRQNTPLSGHQKRSLMALATQTWRFFSEFTLDIPPDHILLRPEIRISSKTSPTNIAMYLLSCLCAAELGLIDAAESNSRIEKAVTALEQLPKWNGQPYNWYDINTHQPIEPYFISSVDNGNLSAALLTLSAADIDPTLSHRAAQLARSMNMDLLFDPACQLFYTGIDAVTSQPTRSHYDLYSSEARLLSLASIALGQAPPSHWSRLGRRIRRSNDQYCYTSWSGTMFEYLMPDLIFEAPFDSAWHISARNAVRIQISRAKMGLWGISESACAEKDPSGDYSYRAFGVRDLAYANDVTGDVFAPYAAALALQYRPCEAADVLIRAAEQGYASEYGLFEAIDMRSDHAEPVYSHMAHHQGMLLCAITNALCDGFLRKTALRLPEFRAVQPLLHEQFPRQHDQT